MKMYFILNLIIKFPKNIQGLKIYLTNGQNLIDIQLIYEDNPEISRHLIVEGNKNADILKTLIKDVVKIFPKLNDLDLEVTEIRKKDEKENKFQSIKENEKIKSQFTQKDKIYFKLNLKEIWLNVDMTLVEEKNLGYESDSYSLYCEVKNANNMDNIEDNMANVGLYLWKYRGKEGTEDITDNNEENNEEKNININEEKGDYYIFYKIDVSIKNPKKIINDEIQNNVSGRKKSGTMKKNNFNSATFLNDIRNINNNKNVNHIKSNIEMNYLDIQKEEREKSGINLNHKKDNEFSMDNKIDCTLKFLNFTNYIIDDKIFLLENRISDNSEIKEFFNNNFHKFYKEIELKNNMEMCIENKRVYLKSTIVNDTNNNISDLNDNKCIFDVKPFEHFYSMGSIQKEEIYSKKEKEYIEKIKKINFNKKLMHLNPYLVKSNFKLQKEFNYLRNFQNIELKKGNKNSKNFENNEELKNNIIKIKEQNLSINTGNDTNLLKKGIIVTIILILIIIILFKNF